MNTPAMTVLFTDTEGSTEFTSVRGDEMGGRAAARARSASFARPRSSTTAAS